MFDNCNTWLGPILWFLGAFILGYLLRLFMGQSRRKKDSERIAELETTNESLQATIDQGGNIYGDTADVGGMEKELRTLKAQLSDYELQLSTLTGQLKDSRERNAELEAQLQRGGAMGTGVSAGESDEDDLKRIEGVGPNVEKILNGAGIHTWTQLADTQPSRLREILDQEGGRFQYLDPTSWPQQAALAREGKWKELEVLQEELIGGVYYGPAGQYKDADDLKRIEGIGPRVEGLLNNAGIHTWGQLANTDRDRLKEILNVAGGRFKDLEPASWPQQAALADAGKWKELDALQEELIGGVMVSKPTSKQDSAIPSDGDDLKIIEGLGHKAEQTLNAEGINTFEELAQKTPAELRGILDQEGNRFANLDPSSWPQQARLAASGHWEDLEKLQDELIGGLYVGPVGSQIGDDLKRIEGIGPRIEGLLSNGGISTYQELADADLDQLNGILDAAGHPYSDMDPSIWKVQARLAADGNWDELYEMQNEIILGIYGKESGKDDLKMIEGIGPKTEALLNEAGIKSFEDLKNTDVDELKGILSEGGFSLDIVKPDTWGQQASLAADGKWDEFYRLQEQIVAGEIVPGPSEESLGQDDLKVIEGIGVNAAKVLQVAGINSFEVLSEKTPEELKAILDQHGYRFANLDPSSWPQQAWLAASGRWEDLEELQDQLIGGQYKMPGGKDDLKLIEGIGPKIELILNDAGIHTFQQLAETDPNRLREILDQVDSRYRIIKPNSWPRQAQMAMEGKWNDLYNLQDELIAGRISGADDLKQIEGIGPKVENLLQGAGISNMEQLASSDPAQLKSILDRAGNRYRFIDPSSWPQQAKLAQTGQVAQLHELQEQLYAGAFINPVQTTQPDDLKRIEGIGPKIENLLNDAGITTWDDLANTPVDRLRSILDNAGKRYQIHDPSSWPEQAALARDGKWTELDQLQEELIGGIRKAPLAQAAPTTKDDLKKIEGIGPKIERLLNDAGIYTWRQLADSNVDHLKEILQAAGDRYKIHDPATWPQQADLAAQGKWEELKQLQDDLIGGRETK